MRKAQLTMVAGFLLILSFPAPTEAQFGGFIDKIQKLSGPRFVGYGATVRLLENWGQKPAGEDARVLHYLHARATNLSTEYRTGRQGVTARLTEIDTNLSRCATRLATALDNFERALGYDEKRVDVLRLWIDERAGRIAALSELLTPESFERQLEETDELTCAIATLTDSATVNEDKGYNRFLLRFGLHGRYDEDSGGDADQTYFEGSLSVSVEWLFTPAGGPLDFGIELGGSGHKYFGRNLDTFEAPSAFLNLSYHPFARCASWLLRNFRIGTGVRHYWLPGPAFADIHQSVDTNVYIMGSLTGFDLSLSALKPTKHFECDDSWPTRR